LKVPRLPTSFNAAPSGRTRIPARTSERTVAVSGLRVASIGLISVPSYGRERGENLAERHTVNEDQRPVDWCSKHPATGDTHAYAHRRMPQFL
jgi:hypothetical protein